MTAFTRGLGTKLHRSPLGTTYTEVSNVFALTPPGVTRQSMDVSDLDDAWDRRAPANKGGNQLRASLRFSPAETIQSTLYADFLSDDIIFYKVELSDATEQIVEGFIVEWNPQGISRDGDVQVEIAIEVDDDVPYPS